MCNGMYSRYLLSVTITARSLAVWFNPFTGLVQSIPAMHEDDGWLPKRGATPQSQHIYRSPAIDGRAVAELAGAIEAPALDTPPLVSAQVWDTPAVIAETVGEATVICKVGTESVGLGGGARVTAVTDVMLSSTSRKTGASTRLRVNGRRMVRGELLSREHNARQSLRLSLLMQMAGGFFHIAFCRVQRFEQSEAIIRRPVRRVQPGAASPIVLQTP